MHGSIFFTIAAGISTKNTKIKKSSKTIVTDICNGLVLILMYMVSNALKNNY